MFREERQRRGLNIPPDHIMRIFSDNRRSYDEAGQPSAAHAHRSPGFHQVTEKRVRRTFWYYVFRCSGMEQVPPLMRSPGDSLVIFGPGIRPWYGIAVVVICLRVVIGVRHIGRVNGIPVSFAEQPIHPPDEPGCGQISAFIITACSTRIIPWFCPQIAGRFFPPCTGR